ncbi:MAG: DUF2207 domain-containing protein [Candidatus Moranbacteria bacterium]|nr:DUF2207 domain-containing protein [Candidatus Moranbacteria bacterium]
MMLIRSTFVTTLKVQVILGLFVWVFAMQTMVVQAQTAERSYSYDSIRYALQVNTDTTVDVTETQTYRFVGEYHQGWRNIPKSKFDALTDVVVIDAATGLPLQFSAKKLDKTQPSNWNKYTAFYKDGEYVIEWYYDARDTTRTWILQYTLHGAIGFYTDHDELYWNLFTDYAVPIGSVDVDVTLPHAVESTSILQESFYVTSVPSKQYGATHSPAGFHFYANDIAPYAKLTIAPGWPKGLVDAGAYWRSWWFRNWGYIGAGILTVLTPLLLLSRWYLAERFRTGRGTIVPEYEPPQHLPPAMADILVHEKLSSKAWSATVVDLAVRGYLRVIEEKSQTLVFLEVFILILYGIIIFVTLIFFLISVVAFSWLSALIALVVIVFGIFRISKEKAAFSLSYSLEKITKTAEESTNLQDFEKAFMKALFVDGDRFSIEELRRNRAVAVKFSQKIQKIGRAVLQETARDTHAYTVDFAKWKWLGPSLPVAVVFFILFVIVLFNKGFGGFFIFFPTLIFCITVSYLFVRYNPRLNREGQILREEWLGFELYLRTAERYRLQNLTPETFEKFLPYAIIFGVEKEWGKAFAGMTIPQPQWYAGSMGTTSAFSAAQFSSSFSASFSSAFASAGGSGASGGGGGAGGGGGGGGGGAS